MSGKRAAPYQIDQKTLEQKQVQQTNNPSDVTNKNQKSSIENRKIFKIRMPGSQSSLTQNKVSFKLQQNIQQKVDNQKQKSLKDQTLTTNIFANLAKPSFNGIGLFSNVQTTSNFANLFTSNKNTQNSSKITANSSNIFQNKTQNVSANIFKPKTETSSIFALSKKQNSEDDEDEQDSAELQKQQEIEFDPKKSSIKYEYKQTCPIIFSAKCAKFKKNNGDLISNVQVVLQKDNETKMSFLSVKLSQTQTSIFSGIILQGKSSARHINNKQENVQVGLIQKQRQKFSKVILKFQFSEKEEGKLFYKQIQNLVNSNSKQQQTRRVE